MKMQREKIRVERYSLARLMQEIELGKLRIPRFQREYIWDRARVRALLDSMVKEYPIGTLFIWEAPAEYNRFLRNVKELQQPPLNSNESYAVILDGQQRLTSLYSVVKGLSVDDEDFSRLVIDLGVEDAHHQNLFSFRHADNNRLIAVRDLLAEDMFEIYENLQDRNYKSRFQLYRGRLNNYPFSVVLVSNMDLSETVEIFERINQQGKRLSRYDLIAASILTEDFDLRERTEIDLLEKLSDHFRDLSETSIPQALALNSRNNSELQTQLNLTSSEVQNAWNKTIKFLLHSVNFVSENFGVHRLEFLPYEAMLPVLQHYFYVSDSYSVASKEHFENISKWFWQATFSNRFGGSPLGVISNDAALFRRMLGSEISIDMRLSVSVESLENSFMSQATSAVRNGILCLLNLQRPCRFDSGLPIQLNHPDFGKFTRADAHHIFPSGFLKQQGFETKEVHRIPNFCFIPNDINRKNRDLPPNEIFSEYRKNLGEQQFVEVMRSHLIPWGEDSGIWTNDYKLFLRQRASLLLEEIEQICGIKVRISVEQQNPVIDMIETALRDHIHNTLFGVAGTRYWKSCVQTIGGGTIHQQIQKRIDEHIRKTPGVSQEDFKRDLRVRWNFADVSEYAMIIVNNKNWRHFSETFESKEKTQQNLSDFREFRNCVKHNRKLEAIHEYRGKAAILWLSSTLKIDLSGVSHF